MVIIVRMSGEVNGANTVFCEEKHCMLNCKSECIPCPDFVRTMGSFKFFCYVSPKAGWGMISSKDQNITRSELRTFKKD